MLSISKLVAGQARYYLDQARGRVDVVESVGDGVEEYYAGGSEACGQWLGAGAAADLAVHALERVRAPEFGLVS